MTLSQKTNYEEQVFDDIQLEKTNDVQSNESTLVSKEETKVEDGAPTIEIEELPPRSSDCTPSKHVNTVPGLKRLSDPVISTLDQVQRIVAGGFKGEDFVEESSGGILKSIFGRGNQEQEPVLLQPEYDAILRIDDDEVDEDGNVVSEGKERVMLGYAAHHGAWFIPPEIRDNLEHWKSHNKYANAVMGWVPSLPWAAYDG